VGTVEIVVVGNEVLLGLTQDTNSNYLCRILTGLGATVKRIAVVRDDIAAIAEEVSISLTHRTELVITCGGLGPTEDDMTLAGVASACKRKLVIDSTARSFVQQRYRELALEGFVVSAEMNESRLKMATLPEGAEIIENSVGTAPAVLLKVGQSRIVSLPGVPNELKTIVEGPLMPILIETFGIGKYVEREMIVDCGDESVLSTLLAKASAAHTDVYIKSRAASFGRENRFRISLSTAASTEEEGERLLDRASDDLRQILRVSGITERPIQNDSPTERKLN
jgi:molybdenum cofactor synthesis domain-containing protein